LSNSCSLQQQRHIKWQENWLRHSQISQKTLRTTSKVFVLKPLPSTHLLGSYIFTYLLGQNNFVDTNPLLWQCNICGKTCTTKCCTLAFQHFWHCYQANITELVQQQMHHFCCETVRQNYNQGC